MTYLSMHSFFHFGRRPAASKTRAAAASCPSASRMSAASRGSAPQLCTGVRGWFWIQQLIEFQQAPAAWATAEGGFGAVVEREFGSVTESGARARTAVVWAPVEQPPIRAASMTG